MKTRKIIITGNHHTPAIELINQLQKDKTINWQIFYITHSTDKETHLSNSLNLLLKKNIYQIKSGKYYRYSILKTIKEIPQIINSFISSSKLIKQIKPDVVISFGGYVSVPIVIAAYFLGIPSLTHEQTVTLSLSTLINSFFVKNICLSFEFTNLPFFLKKKAIVTGNLLRRQIYNTTTKSYSSLINKINKKPLIYISGGNQSSKIINDVFLEIKDSLSTKYTIIHHIGNLDYSLKKQPNYYPTTYVDLDDIGWVLNNSHIIINRSGANNCQEIVALNKNSILIPLPIAQQNEQLKNAQWVKNQQPQKTIIIDQSKLNKTTLLSAINFFSKTERTSPVKPIINNKVLKLLHRYV